LTNKKKIYKKLTKQDPVQALSKLGRRKIKKKSIKQLKEEARNSIY
jgi:hypothetical protein